MKRVTGIGGLFFKSSDPEKLYHWYETHLGIQREAHGQGATFDWSAAKDEGREGVTAWAVFPHNTKYFDPSHASFMINYRVDDMQALLEALREEGVSIEGQADEEYGRFAWIMDPDGNRVELWEPPKKK